MKSFKSRENPEDFLFEGFEFFNGTGSELKDFKTLIKSSLTFLLSEKEDAIA